MEGIAERAVAQSFNISANISAVRDGEQQVEYSVYMTEFQAHVAAARRLIEVTCFVLQGCSP